MILPSACLQSGICEQPPFSHRLLTVSRLFGRHLVVTVLTTSRSTPELEADTSLTCKLVDAQMKMPDAQAHRLCLLLFALVFRFGTAAEVSVWKVDINSVGVTPSICICAVITQPVMLNLTIQGVSQGS